MKYRLCPVTLTFPILRWSNISYSRHKECLSAFKVMTILKELLHLEFPLRVT